MSTSCIFCKIANKEMSTSFVHETDDIIVFKDIKPSADTHLLIVPKHHIETFLDLKSSDPLLTEMFQLARDLIKKLDLQKQYKLVINGGKNQIVPHLHMHLMGGKMKGLV